MLSTSPTYLVKIHISRKSLPRYFHLENMANWDDGIRHAPRSFDPRGMPPAIPGRSVLVTIGSTVSRMMIYQGGRQVVVVIVLADIVEDQVVLLQTETQRQWQQEQDTRKDARMFLHVSGKSSVAGIIPCCYTCNRLYRIRSYRRDKPYHCRNNDRA